MREPLRYKSPKDEKFKYMLAQLRLDRQKADDERQALLALKGNLHSNDSYKKDVQLYMKKFMEGSICSASTQHDDTSSLLVELALREESYPLPWLSPL